MRILDPDTNWRSRASVEHFMAGTILRALFGFIFPPWGAWLAVLYTAVVYEVGQADIANSAGLIGRPGYGFGLMDIGLALVGAGVWEVARLISSLMS